MSLGENAIKVVGGVVIAGISFAAGYVVSNIRGEKNAEILKNNLEEANKQLRSVLSLFEMENAKMESIIADFTANPPKNLEELRARLRKAGLSLTQINRICSSMAERGFFGDVG
ncbi:hypothetical protein ACI2KR_08105 [Pseudomonas luteola]